MSSLVIIMLIAVIAVTAMMVIAVAGLHHSLDLPFKPLLMPSPPSREELRGHAREELEHGWQLAFEDEDFVLAQDALDAVDKAVLPTDELPILESALAWCEAHLGKIETALFLANTSVGSAPPDRARARGCALAVLGALSVRAGHAHTALDPLREAVRITEDPLHKTLASFFLGEALFATGSAEAARQAWDDAINCAPESRYAQRARERMATMEMAAPYR